jgi:hypothetical protein
MHEWYMKLFRRLLNATAMKFMVICRQNIGNCVHWLIFSVSLVEGLFTSPKAEAKHIKQLLTMQQNMSLHDYEGDISLTKFLLLEKECRPQRRCMVSTKHRTKKDTKFCIIECDVRLCLKDYLEAYNTKISFLR